MDTPFFKAVLQGHADAYIPQLAFPTMADDTTVDGAMFAASMNFEAEAAADEATAKADAEALIAAASAPPDGTLLNFVARNARLITGPTAGGVDLFVADESMQYEWGGKAVVRLEFDVEISISGYLECPDGWSGPTELPFSQDGVQMAIITNMEAGKLEFDDPSLSNWLARATAAALRPDAFATLEIGSVRGQPYALVQKSVRCNRTDDEDLGTYSSVQDCADACREAIDCLFFTWVAADESHGVSNGSHGGEENEEGGGKTYSTQTGRQLFGGAAIAGVAAETASPAVAGSCMMQHMSSAECPEGLEPSSAHSFYRLVSKHAIDPFGASSVSHSSAKVYWPSPWWVKHEQLRINHELIQRIKADAEGLCHLRVYLGADRSIDGPAMTQAAIKFALHHLDLANGALLVSTTRDGVDASLNAAEVAAALSAQMASTPVAVEELPDTCHMACPNGGHLERRSLIGEGQLPTTSQKLRLALDATLQTRTTASKKGLCEPIKGFLPPFLSDICTCEEGGMYGFHLFCEVKVHDPLQPFSNLGSPAPGTNELAIFSVKLIFKPCGSPPSFDFEVFIGPSEVFGVGPYQYGEEHWVKIPYLWWEFKLSAVGAKVKGEYDRRKGSSSRRHLADNHTLASLYGLPPELDDESLTDTDRLRAAIDQGLISLVPTLTKPTEADRRDHPLHGQNDVNASSPSSIHRRLQTKTKAKTRVKAKGFLGFIGALADKGIAFGMMGRLQFDGSLRRTVVKFGLDICGMWPEDWILGGDENDWACLGDVCRLVLLQTPRTLLITLYECQPSACAHALNK